MLTNCGRVPRSMIGGQCDKCVCDAPAAGLLRRRLPAPSIATYLIAASALYISAIGHFYHFLRQAAPGTRAPWHVFTTSQRPRSGLCGMGCKARCAVASSAINKRPNAADRPQRPLPEGLERNRAIGRPGCLHGHEPMRPIRGLHSSRLHSNAISKKTLSRLLGLWRFIYKRKQL